MSIAVIGCGDWGKNIARTLHEMGALSCICDHGNDAYSKGFDIPMRDYQEVLTDPNIKGVMIATPTQTHFSIARDFLLAGKHIFVEKPVVTSLEALDILQEIATARNLVVMGGHLLRYHPAFEQVVSWARGGELGRLKSIHSYRKNLGKVYPGESVLWDLGPHDVSMVLEVFGELPNKVFASGQSYISLTDADDAFLSLEFPGGKFAQIQLSRFSPQKEQKLMVMGLKKMAVFDDTHLWNEKAQLYDSGIDIESESIQYRRDVEPKSASVFENSPLKLECAHFLNCIQTGNESRTGPKEIKRVLRVLTSLETSFDGGQWVEVK